jgi:hypothetical protein
VKDQIESIEREIDKVKAALVELEKRLKAMEAAGSNLDAIRTEKVRFMKHRKAGLTLFTLREKFEEHNESEVRIADPCSRGSSWRATADTSRSSRRSPWWYFYFDRQVGRIQEKPLA